MKTLVFSIIQSILVLIIPVPLLQAITDYISKPSTIDTEIAGKAIAVEEIRESKINFPAAVLPTITAQPPPLIGEKIAPVVKAVESPVETVEPLIPPPVPEMKKLYPPLSLGQKVLNLGLTKKGDPYVWGATGPDAFDCSGLVYWLYAQFGVHLNRIAIDQASNGYAVSDPAPGDIVVLSGGGHVGIYAGDDMVLNAPQSGDVVKLSPLSNFSIYAIRRI